MRRINFKPSSITSSLNTTWANSDKPLPPVKIELANNMAAAGGYSFGEGVVVLPGQS
ncbi:MAG: hypothetical protein R3D26_10725 [Cyanobacteriota/Melainabacteria group bacterium]